MNPVALFAFMAMLGCITRLPILAAEPKANSKDLEFFESRIRPVLAENCYKCHSQGAEKIKGGLLLDSREGWVKGGNTGPVIVPGDLEKSLLIQAVRYQDKDLQMPPNDRKLSDQQIADLEQWVRMGAPDPRTSADTKHDYKVDLAKIRKQHWAYQPVSRSSIPAVNDPQNWVKTPVDSFILAKLQANNLAPSPAADKVTLIRRATFDLHGLPPSVQEVDDFLADSSPDAFAKVVDRLLASPRYGERWGRHWLDLAKYADTKGPVGQNQDPRYLYAWTYRDWVIRAFNDDLPYDQFILRQIAADKLLERFRVSSRLAGEFEVNRNGSNNSKPETSNSKLETRDFAALGFLTLGNRFNNQINDIIDDRIDLIGKATMGTTLSCARCHDHKFDPIPTKDYYSLHGVFASSTEPREGPLLEEPPDTPAYKAFLNELAAAEGAVETFKEETARRLALERLTGTGEYLLALHEFKQKADGMSRDAFLQRRGLSRGTGNAWAEALRNWQRKHHPIFAPWFAFDALDEAEFTTKAKELSTKFYANTDSMKPLNPLVMRMFSTAPTSLKQLASRYEALFIDVDKRWHAALESYETRKRLASTPPPTPTGLPDAEHEEIRKLLYARNSPTYLDEQRVNQLIDRDDRLRNRRNALARAINEVKANHPGSPARAHVLSDSDKPRDSYVFVRGNPGNRGAKVPRQFLEVLSPENRAPFKDGSGRLELAQAIISKDNPLTARVMANRMWLHHFGEGFVRTPDDFGTRSEPPTHPELLDWLASEFVQPSFAVEALNRSSVKADAINSASTLQRFNVSTPQPWSIKHLHRLIMLSSVYQQSSDDNPRQAQIDPDNHWLWRMNRRRLDFEALRDTILFIGNKLDFTMGGPSVRLNSEPYSRRRSVYGFVDRNNLPNMYLTFDFANPDLTTGKRETTIVPQQALFMMNSPLVIEQGRDLVRRDDFKALTDDRERLQLLYRLIYQRAPTDMEMKLALDYVRSEPNAGTSGAQVGQTAWEYGYGIYDPQTKRTKNFTRLTTFRDGAWRPNTRRNDAKLAELALTAGGGMPALEYAAIRRWTVPRDGVVYIDGVLSHQSKQGDGVRAAIISSGSGFITSWNARTTNVLTRLPRLSVKRGDTVDFFVSALASTKGDNFAWAPTVRMIDGKAAPGEIVLWDAKKEFREASDDDRLGAWEKFAQVLLQTNELTFIN